MFLEAFILKVREQFCDCLQRDYMTGQEAFSCSASILKGKKNKEKGM